MSENSVLDIPSEVFSGAWSVVELFGHKVVAGFLQLDESLGAPLLRLDVPQTSKFPAFTRFYNHSAIYSVSLVSEEVASRLAESIKDNPVIIYSAEIDSIDSLKSQNDLLQKQLDNLRAVLNDAQSSVSSDKEIPF